MAELNFRNKKIYYEVHGNCGEPILLLNGIMMSAKSWTAFVENFSQSNTLILMDFLDQGASSLMDGDGEGTYTHALQIDAVCALIDHLKLAQVNICGISYGAEVGLGYACQNPERVRRLILFNGAARTSPQLKDIGDSWNEAAKQEGGLAYYLTAIPMIYSDVFYEHNYGWMQRRRAALEPFFANQAVKDRLVRLTKSSETFDCTKKLKNLEMPVLVVSADSDYLVPVREQQMLLKGIKDAHHLILTECGHASMYEKPLLFCTLVLGFINAINDKLNIL